jgi:hypothetical protein
MGVCRMAYVIPDECVDSDGGDVVQLLDGLLDLPLVGGDIDNKDQSVVVLDLLHGGLSGEGEPDHIELLRAHGSRTSLHNHFRASGELKRLGLVEVHLRADHRRLAAGTLLERGRGLLGCGRNELNGGGIKNNSIGGISGAARRGRCSPGSRTDRDAQLPAVDILTGIP